MNVFGNYKKKPVSPIENRFSKVYIEKVGMIILLRPYRMIHPTHNAQTV